MWAKQSFYADHDFPDILFPHPCTRDKLSYIRNKILKSTPSSAKKPRIVVGVDHSDIADGLIRFANEFQENFDVYLDVDPGENRSGFDPNDAGSLEIARKLVACPLLHLRGLYVHGGHSYGSLNAEGIKAIAQLEVDTILRFQEKLRGSGIDVPVLAIGSTPTAIKYSELGAIKINEIHPGNYIFYDAMQVSLGSCRPNQIALTVLCRVMSKYSFPHNRLLIDAGAFALSKDRGAIQFGPVTYGTIVGHPELVVSDIFQEVSIVEAAPGRELKLDDFPVGSLLRIVPNHSCLSAYCYDHLHVVNSRLEVVDQWETCPRHSSSSF